MKATAEDALSRLDERLRVSPIREGWIARTHFIDACASAWIDGELVHIEDLVLHDASMDIRSPTRELTRTHAVLRARRRILGEAPQWAMSPSGCNAVALDGAVREPLFLLNCLIRQGQIQKALAQALKYIGTDALAPGQGRLLSELTAALYLARPVPLAAGDSDPPARVEWIAAADAGREALAALTAQKTADEIELLLAKIWRARRSVRCG